MASYNKVILGGTLVEDPETFQGTQGSPICKFSMAMNRKFGSNEEVAFVDVTAFGKQAETVAKFFKKGKFIFIEGRLKTDSWMSKEKEKRSKLVVTMENMVFLGGGEKSKPHDDQEDFAY